MEYRRLDASRLPQRDPLRRRRLRHRRYASLNMTGPLDAVTACHNAFRRDISLIDEAALALARGKTGLEPQLERFRFFNERLTWHAHGEELAVFPALDRVAPLVAEPYLANHRGLDTLTVALSEAVSAGDALATARATAAFKFHLDIHLRKEDAHVYRLMRERLEGPDQGRRHYGGRRATRPFRRRGHMASSLAGHQRPGERDKNLADDVAGSGLCGARATHPYNNRRRLGRVGPANPFVGIGQGPRRA